MKTQMGMVVGLIRATRAVPCHCGAASRGDPTAVSVGEMVKDSTMKTRGDASATETPTSPETTSAVLGTTLRLGPQFHFQPRRSKSPRGGGSLAIDLSSSPAELFSFHHGDQGNQEQQEDPIRALTVRRRKMPFLRYQLGKEHRRHLIHSACGLFYFRKHMIVGPTRPLSLPFSSLFSLHSPHPYRPSPPSGAPLTKSERRAASGLRAVARAATALGGCAAAGDSVGQLRGGGRR